MKFKGFTAFFAIFSAIISIFLCFWGMGFSKEGDKPAALSLRSYKNTVALFEGETLIRTYDGVVLNILPEGDKQRFYRGIEVDSEEQAQRILEDYDS